MSTSFDEALPASGSGFGVGLRAAASPASWDWEELNRDFRPRLIAAGVARFGLTREECEDAAQNVFLKILYQNPRVRDARAYLRAAFLNQCQNIAEARARRRARETDMESSGEFADPHDDPCERVERIRLISALGGAYRRVGEKCRRVIKSYCLEDRPLAESAEAAGFSTKTVWKRLQECLKRMRLCLQS